MKTDESKTDDTSLTTAAAAAATLAAATGNAATAAANGPSPQVNRQFLLAFQRLEGEISAVPQAELSPVNVDLRMVVTTIVGAHPEILRLRPALSALGSFDISLLDKLRDYALALGHAHTLYMMSDTATDDMATLATEGLAIRDQLRADATALAKRGLVSQNLVAKLQNSISYRGIAFDLVAISETLIADWPKLSGKVAFTLDELEAASSLGNRMVELVGQRDQAPVIRDKLSVLRQQAFTLCAEAYEEVRLAVGYVRRRERDADKIAPSLFLSRGRRRTEGESESGPESNAPFPPDFVVSPGAASSGTGNTASTTNNAANPAAPNGSALASNTTAANVPVGHPGSPAFKRA